MSDELLKQLFGLVLGIMSLLGIGVGARQVMSRYSRERAKNETEEDIFKTSVAELRNDRDQWRKTAEDSWEAMRRVEREKNDWKHEARNYKFALQAQRKMVANRCPELLPYMPSEPSPFDDEPHG